MRNDIGERNINFAADVIKMIERIPEKTVAKKLNDQLIRSVTSVGANYEEAQAAESKKDFVHKLQVSLKEMRETYYWLRVIEKISPENINITSQIDEARQLRAILSKSVATSKGKSKES